MGRWVLDFRFLILGVAPTERGPTEGRMSKFAQFWFLRRARSCEEDYVDFLAERTRRDDGERGG